MVTSLFSFNSDDFGGVVALQYNEVKKGKAFTPITLIVDGNLIVVLLKLYNASSAILSMPSAIVMLPLRVSRDRKSVV